MANIPWLRAVLMHYTMQSAWTQPLAVLYWPYTTNPKVPYCDYKLVTNVIRAVKIHVCHTRGIWSAISRLSANQHSGIEPTSL